MKTLSLRPHAHTSPDQLKTAAKIWPNQHDQAAKTTRTQKHPWPLSKGCLALLLLLLCFPNAWMSCISQARPGYASVTNNPQKPNITKILTYAACPAREGSAHCNHSWAQPTEARMTSQWEPLDPCCGKKSVWLEVSHSPSTWCEWERALWWPSQAPVATQQAWQAQQPNVLIRNP